MDLPGDEGFHRVSDILRCKWTMSILDGIASGYNRPSVLERNLDGLTTKVLNQRIEKLERFGIITKQVFDEHPPRTEYHFTPRGLELTKLIALIREFANGW